MTRMENQLREIERTGDFSFSYGLVQFLQDGDTEKELIREVDSRMYKYKRKYGRGR